MRRRKFALVLFFLTMGSAAFARGKVDGWCEQGGQSVLVPASAASTTKVQRSYTACTVNVYLPGAVTLATIYADDNGTAKANPFTASSTGQWFFYADNGNYDVNFSGAGISPTFTRGDIFDIDPQRIGGTRYADTFTGADACVKIQAAIADLPSTGGTVDARAFEGVQPCSVNPYAGTTKSVVLMIGAAIYQNAASASWTPTGGKLIGAGETVSLLTTASTTDDILTVQVNPVEISSLGLRYTANATKTAGAALHVASGGKCICDNIFIEPSFIGIQMDASTSAGFENIFIGATSNTPAAANWSSAVLLKGATTTITDTLFDHLIVSIDRPCSAGGCVIVDGLTDTIQFQSLEVVAQGTCRPASGAGTCGAMMLFQSTIITAGDVPRWIRCVSCVFEAGINDPAIKVTDGKDIRFANSYAASGLNELLITNVNGFTWDNSVTLQSDQALIKVTGGTGVYITNSRFSGASQAANGVYNAIDVAAGVTEFFIIGNNFGDELFNYTNHPNYFINIAAGNSNSYAIANNNFQGGGRVTGDLNDLGTGTAKNIFGNTTGKQSFTAGINMRTGAPLSFTNDVYFESGLPTTPNILGLHDAGTTSAFNFSPSYGALTGVYPVYGGWNGTGTNTGSLAFGDGSGYYYTVGANVAGVFTPRTKYYDDGRTTWNPIHFASINIVSTVNGTTLYCDDCTNASNPCVGGGTGAFAKRLSGAWDCR